jgi:autotransporter-associated beta strand protein/T5SS/PEP-CTERM-associated repeat protein
MISVRFSASTEPSCDRRSWRTAARAFVAAAAIVTAFSGLFATADPGTTISGTTTLANPLTGRYVLSDADGPVLMEGASEIDGVASFSFNYTIDPTVPATLAAELSGTGGLELTSAGTLLITGNNTYSGGTTITDGTIAIGSASALGSGTISFANVSSPVAGMLQYTSGITTDYSGQISSAGNQRVIIDTNSENVTFATGLAGAGTVLTKLGEGTLTLSGVNNYTGDTTAFGGTLAVTTGGSITTTTGSLSVGAGTFSVTGGAVSVANVTANGGNVAVSSGTLNASAVLTLGDDTFGAPNTSTMTVGGGSVTAGSTVLGSTAGSSGTLIVSAGTFTSTGDLTVGVAGSGQIRVDTAGTIAVGGTLTKAVGSTIDILNGGTLRIGLGSTTGTLDGDLTLGGGTLVFDRSNASTYGGILDGSGSVTKAGAGTLTLTGANTYSGPTTISSGTLQIGDGSTTGSITGDVVNNATLVFNRSDPLSYAGAITGSGALVQAGVGTLTLTGVSNYSGSTTIAAGTLEVATGGSVDSTGSLMIGDGTTAALVVSGGSLTNAAATIGNGASGDGSATISAGTWTNTGNLAVGADTATGTLSINGTGTVIVAGDLTKGDNGTINLASGGTLQIGNGGASGTLGTDLVNDGALVFARTGSSSYGGVISGTGTVTQQGSGILSLSGANTYSGGTTIANGTLDVSTGGSIDHAGTDLSVGAGGTLSVSGGSVSNLIGTVGDQGAGTATVTGGSWTNADELRVGWGDGVVSADGTLTIQNGAVTNTNAYLGSGAGSVGQATVSGGTWTSSGAVRIGFGGASGSLTVSGGTVNNTDGIIGEGSSSSGNATITSGTWANSNSLAVGSDGGTGTLTMSGGALSSATGSVGSLAGSSGTATISGGTWTNDGDLVIGNDGTGTLSISGTGTVIVGGSLYKGVAGVNGSGGTIELSSGGTLKIGSNGGNLQTDLTNNGTLVFENSDDSTYAGSIDGNGLVRFAMPSDKVLNLFGSNAWSGGTALDSGTLLVSNSSALGTAGTISFGGGTLQFSSDNTVDYSSRFDGSGGQTIKLDTNGLDVTLASAIAGAGSTLEKLGGGTLILTGNNTFTGLSTVSEGMLQIGSGAGTGSLTGNIHNDATLAFDRSGALTYGGVISGTGTLRNQGPGTVTLAGTNTFTGDTLLQAGTLSLGSSAALGSSGTISFTGGALQFTAANTSDLSARFSTADNQAYKLDTNGQNVTLASNLTSSGGSLEKLGTGKLSLSGDNTFAGGTTLAGGVLSLESTGALGPADPTDPAAGPISFAGGTLQYTANNAIDYSARFSTSAGQTYSIDTNGQSVTFASDLTSGGASLAKLGAGTLSLTGSNGVSGGLSLQGGTVELGSADAIGNSGPIEFRGGTLQFTAANTDDVSGRFSAATGQAFRVDTNGQTVAFDTAIDGTGNTFTKLGSGTLTLSADNTYTGTTTVSAGTLRIGDGGATGAVAGDIVTQAALVFDRSGSLTTAGNISGTGSLEKLGDGTVTLTGNNSYTGGTQINAGTLAVGSTGALGSSGAISFGGGTLQYSSGNNADYSSRISSADGQAIRIDTSGRSVTFAAGLAGAGSTLEKLGAGTLTLSAANTYNGGTNIGGGTLAVTSGGAISHGAADLTVGTSSGSGELLVSGGSVTSANALLGTAAGSTGTATITSGSWDTTGALKVGEAAGATGVLTIQGGSVTSDSSYLGFAAGSSGTATVTGGTWTNSGDLRVGNDGTGALGISGSGVVAVGGSLFQGGSGSIDLASGGTLRIGLGGTTGELLTDLAVNGTLVFDRSDDSSYFGILSGTGAVTKLGGGTLTLTGQSTLTGLTTITAGTLQIGDGTVDGAIAGNALNNASLAFNTLGTETYAGNISGSGDLTKSGVGTLTLTGSSSYSGGTNFDGGTVVLGSADALGASGTLSFDGGVMRYSGANTTDYSDRFSTAGNQAFAVDTAGQDVSFATGLSGAGSSLEKLGGGTLTLTGANTYDAGTTVTAGTLRIGNGGTTGSLVGDIANAGAVVFDRSDDSTFAGAISGTGTLAKLGDGTLTLSGANTFTGLATIQSGTLSIGGGGTTGAIDADVVNNGVLAFNRSDASGYAGSVSGTGSLLKLGDGTLTLSGSSSYSGSTTVNDGTLAVAAGGALNHASADLIVGADGSTAALNVAGGDITVDRSYLGSNGTGSATVTAGTWTTNDSLFVGFGSTGATSGTLNLISGTVQTGDAYLGVFASGTGSATVSGGTWTNLGDLLIGFNGGRGSLDISGGTASTASALIGTSASSTGTINVTGGTWTSSGDVTVGSVDGTGTLTISGSGTALIGGTLSRGDSGSINLAGGGTLQIGLGGASGSLAGDLLNNGTLIFNRLDDSSVTGSISGAGTVTKLGAGILSLEGTNSYTGGTTIAAGAISLGSTDALGTTGTISFTGGALQFTAANTADYSSRFSTAANQAYKLDTNGRDVTLTTGLSSSGGTLTKLGDGTLTLTGVNTFTGLTTVATGTLQIGNGGTTGSIAGNIDVDSDLVFNRSGTTTYGGVISGNGNVTKLGSGTLLLTGDKLAFGTTTVAAGTLEIGNGGTTGSLRGDIRNDGTVVFNRSDSVTYAGNIDGAGDVTKLGAGTLTLNGDNTFAGVTRINEGTLAVASAGALGSGSSLPTISFGGGTLQYTTGNQVDYSGQISSAATQAIRIDTNNEAVAFATGLAGASSTLEKLGAGSLTLSGSSSYTGGTTVSGGTLDVTTGGAIAHSSAALAVGTTTGSGAVVVSGGSVSVGDATLGRDASSAGTLTMTSGSFTSSGTLLVGGGSAATGAFDILGGTVTTRDTAIGSGSSSGVATVSGGTWTNTADLSIGNGTLEITGGIVVVGGTLSESTPNSIDLQAGGVLRIGSGGAGGELQANLDFDGDLVFDRSGAASYGGTLAGTGTLTKEGSGTLTLTSAGSFNYTGQTTVAAGSLLVSGTLASSAVVVESGAFLGGSGRIAQSVTVANGGSMSPGTDGTISLLTVGSAVFQAGSQVSFGILADGDLSGTAGVNYDSIRITNSSGVTFGGTLLLNFANPVPVSNGQGFQLFALDGGNPVGHFASVVAAGTGAYAGVGFYRRGPDEWVSTYGTTEQYLRFDELTGRLEVVPEPSTWVMAVAGLAAAGWMARRKQLSRRRAG